VALPACLVTTRSQIGLSLHRNDKKGLLIFAWSSLVSAWKSTFYPHVFSPALIFLFDSEVCHPRCVFKLYGEVNSVKNTTMSIWLNDGVY